jgi:UDP-glucose 4-epimerase
MGEKMNILLTGSSGFIGTSIKNKLLLEGHQITCISRRDMHHEKNDNINFLKFNLSNPLDNNKLPKDIDCILHAAATMQKDLNEWDIFQINTNSTINLLNFGKQIGIKNFVFISSGGIYGYSKSKMSEKCPARPKNFYGLGKYQSELLVNYFNKYFSTVNLRLFFPYGPKQTKGIIPQLTENIKNDREIIIYNEMAPMINPIHLSDVIQSIANALNLSGKYTINICGDEIISIKDLALLISKQLKTEPHFKYITDKKIKNLIGTNVLMKKYLKINQTLPLDTGLKHYLKSIK